MSKLTKIAPLIQKKISKRGTSQYCPRSHRHSVCIKHVSGFTGRCAKTKTNNNWWMYGRCFEVDAEVWYQQLWSLGTLEPWDPWGRFSSYSLRCATLIVYATLVVDVTLVIYAVPPQRWLPRWARRQQFPTNSCFVYHVFKMRRDSCASLRCPLNFE